MNVCGEQDIAPEVRLARKDKRRAAYYQLYTNMQWGDIENYHIALDSGELGADTCVEILCRLF